uniref:AMP-dependent synthetase/ligase domain-containing protein n=1 Tax=Panagrolaimus sp. ES5 TaxID=591445 RepID=A0AC34FXT9_9BILA
MIRDNRSIGKPLKNVKCYVLDENMTAISTPGIIGELYISGTGVAEGYFKLPQKTDERFYKNIFHTENEKDIFDRIYKTGDLVKWLPNGELEFLGRNDFQIKINGIRIEPGEIEATLLKHASIKNAIVASNLALKMQKTNGNFLIGFYTVT